MRRLSVAALSLVVCAAGYGLWHESVAQAPAGTSATTTAASPLVPVEVGLATRRDVPVYRVDLGTVAPFNSVTVHTRVDGELLQVLFTEGADVRKGDLLAVIDPRSFEAALDQATARLQQDTASLANARLILQRDLQLGKDQFASQQAVDTQQSTVAQLEAQIMQDKALISAAQTELSYTQIHAPLDGRLGIRLVDQGNIVHAADAGGLVVINQLHPISVISTVPESEVPALRAALAAGPVEVEAHARGDGSVLDTGTVTLVDNQIDPQSGTLRVKSTFPNVQDRLWPGQSVEARIRMSRIPGAVTVPSDAIMRGPEGTFVFVVGDDDRVTPAPVVTGPIAQGIAVIASGLEPGTRVVVHGQYRLAPGTRVSASTPAPPAE
ncbi:efflux RND transporter periplasmic adaptor subunit [Ancylobacter terrae]|uniref:efflux RND transporter periplasmic adaptor subunit n=1 Tax=Ancylobacter sp. sgz301288 TaxID=3342077 RepID=UPI00386AF9A1